MLGFVAFVSAAACQGVISNIFGGVLLTGIQVYSASGWVIFLSFWVMVYQGLAILQLFLHVKLAYITVPYIKWSVFFLVVRTYNYILQETMVCFYFPLLHLLK